MKPNNTPKKSKYAKGKRIRKDLDPNRVCRACNVAHVRYGSKTGLCKDCLRPLPHPVKKYGTASLPGIMRGYANDMINRCGLELGAKLLQVDMSILDAVAQGKAKLVLEGQDLAPPGTGASAPVTQHEIPPEVLARMVEHYKEFKPLDSAAARLVAPWRRLMEAEVSKELPGPRQQRLRRAKARSDLVRYVPRADAPTDPGAVGNAYGRFDKIGRPRATMAMRPCIGMWGAGLGSPKISTITKKTEWPTSKTSIDRMIRQSRRRFPGAEAVKISDLVLEVWRRPLPGIVGNLDDSEDS